MLRLILKKINIFVVIGAIVIGFVLVLVWTLFARILGPKENATNQPTAVFVIIKAPTLTPTFEPSLTPDTAATQRALEETGQIFVGGYVQISGTDGAGLRLRSGPGLDNPLLFLGYDSEVYKIEDGPQESDGITWWYLVAPYDDARSGWAASDFLTVVSPNE
jgi:hypothetical protein